MPPVFVISVVSLTEIFYVYCYNIEIVIGNIKCKFIYINTECEYCKVIKSVYIYMYIYIAKLIAVLGLLFRLFSSVATH